MNKKILIPLSLLVVGVVCVGGLMWGIKHYLVYYQALSEENVEENALEESAKTEEPLAEGTGIESAMDLPENKVDFTTLKEETNPDIYAWIEIPGTGIDYPIVQHPKEMDYYLDHTLEGTEGYPGAIFTQRMNKTDWSDYNTVIYGHNMKDGSMFGKLHYYGDAKFFEENPYIYIYTDDGRTLAYKVFAAYEYSDLNLVMNFFMNNEEARQEYYDSIWENDGMTSNFDTDISLTESDRIITLSTCISEKADRRYLLQGVLVGEGERNASR